MIVLGLDPGLAALGYGVVRADDRRMTLVALGVLRTRRRREFAVGRDLASIN